jgi:hypothetical protein
MDNIEKPNETNDSLAEYLESVLTEHTNNITMLVAKLVSEAIDAHNMANNAASNAAQPRDSLSSVKSELDALKDELTRERIDLAVDKEIQTHGLNKPLFTAYLNGRVKLGENKQVIVKTDEGDELSLSEFTKAFIETPTGQLLVANKQPATGFGISRVDMAPQPSVSDLLMSALSK